MEEGWSGVREESERLSVKEEGWSGVRVKRAWLRSRSMENIMDLDPEK